MNEDKRKIFFLGLTVVILLFAAMFLENRIVTQEKINKATTLSGLSLKPIDIYEKPIFSQFKRCGNGFCEYEIGETPLSCPEDCFVK